MVISSAFVLIVFLSYGQLQKFYALKDAGNYDSVSFSMHATSGNCTVQSASIEDQSPLSIFGNPDLDKINPSFKYKVVERKCNVSLDLQEFRSSSLGDGLVFAMMRSDEDENNYWKVNFDKNKIYFLDLSYGIGNANVDLSGSSVKSFKINSGTADIFVEYKKDQPNQIAMDPFEVKVDMGTIITKKLVLANADNIIANIGFGKALLDLSDPQTKKCDVTASVGAGNLDVLLPKGNTPIIIYLKDSPLCGVRLAEGFEEVEHNVYVNMDYTVDAKNLLTFDVDVALGSITFHYE